MSADGSHNQSTGFHTPSEQALESPDSHANPLQGFSLVGPLSGISTTEDQRYHRKPGHYRLDTIASGVPMSDDLAIEQNRDDLDENAHKINAS